MATALFFPASPSLFAAEPVTDEKDSNDEESVPELQLGEVESDDWDADPTSTDDGQPELVDDDYNNTDQFSDSMTTDFPESATTEADGAADKEDTNDEQSALMDKEMEEALNADEDTSVSADVLPGGLNNLGNTCYMASAIQMLASLDPLMARLLEEGDNAKKGDDESNNAEILNVFLNTVIQLRDGETVRPSELKQVLDERSPLFCGYQQQDAHEFITTLLDILDEDLKKKKKDEEKEAGDVKAPDSDVEMADGSEENGETKASDEEGPNEPLLTPERTESLSPVANEQNASNKRLKTGAPSAAMPDEADVDAVLDGGEVAGPPAVVRTSASSFSQLNPDEIGLLLHGPESLASDASSSLTPSATSDTPRCKLVGGRMNPSADTRYESVVAPSADAPLDDGAANDDAAPDGSADEAGVAPHPEDAPAETNDTQETEGESQQKEHLSEIESYLTTEVRVRLTCDSCKYTRTHNETFWHLSLELGSGDDGGCSVHDGLSRFFAPEQRQLKCEKCFCETATQTMQIVKLPPALLFHFKRFIVHVSDDYSSISYSKNTSPVSFDAGMTVRENPTLDDEGQEFQNTAPILGSDDPASILSDFLAPDCTLPRPKKCLSLSCGAQARELQESRYALRSVVNHIGSTASCGHYTADCNRRVGGDREWLRFNDAFVSRITEHDATQSAAATAYMILYEAE